MVVAELLLLNWGRTWLVWGMKSICYPTYGGSGVVATELGKNLARLGHEVHFITYAMPYRLNEYFDRIFYHEVKVLMFTMLFLMLSLPIWLVK